MYKLHISLLRAASEGFCQSKYQSQVSTGSARDRSCCSRFLGKIKWLLKFAKPIWKVRAPSSITSSNFVFSDNLSLFTDWAKKQQLQKWKTTRRENYSQLIILVRFQLLPCKDNCSSSTEVGGWRKLEAMSQSRKKSNWFCLINKPRISLLSRYFIDSKHKCLVIECFWGKLKVAFCFVYAWDDWRIRMSYSNLKDIF